MGTSDVATVVLSKIKDHNLRTSELLLMLQADNVVCSVEDIFVAARATKMYGVDRKGIWVSSEDSVEIRDAFNSMTLPFNMEQFFRNRN